MIEEPLFQPLSPTELKKCTDSIEIAYQLIAVTLISRDILIGCLAKHWTWDGQTVSVGFNTDLGEKYGSSYVIDVAVNLIADIRPIPLSEESIPRFAEDDPAMAFLEELGMQDEKFTRLAVQDYPNPLATIICEHNTLIATKNDLFISKYIERALPTEAVPTKGIEFDADLLLYADWEFFERQMGGDTVFTTPILEKTLRPSLQTEVVNRLRNTFVDKSLRKGAFSDAIKECRIKGWISVPEPPESTQIEGEEHILVACISSEDGKAYPVLLKLRALSYPLEFLGYIVSPLTFYGQVMPIPVQVKGKTWKSILLARAIGYFHNP